jgi:hypothetical protein
MKHFNGGACYKSLENSGLMGIRERGFGSESK